MCTDTGGGRLIAALGLALACHLFAARGQPQPHDDDPLRVLLDRLPIPDIPADLTTPQQPCQHLVPAMSAFAHHGEEISYAYLCGVSGEAFRFACDPTSFFPTYFYCSEDVWQNACEALGYESEFVWDLDVVDAVARIHEELLVGHVVLTNGLPGTPVSGEAWCAVAGSDLERSLLYLRTCYELPHQHPWGYQPELYDPATGYLVAPAPTQDWYPPLVGPYLNPRCGFVAIGEPLPRPNRREVVLDALQRAVRFAYEGDRQITDPQLLTMIAMAPDWAAWRPPIGDPEEIVISSGFAAYERWIAWLREPPDPDEVRRHATMQVAEQLCQRLWESRGLAAAFLREVAPLLSDEARQSLLRAADHYQQASARFDLRDSVIGRVLYEEDDEAKRFREEHRANWGEWPFRCYGLLSERGRERIADQLSACLDEERAAIGLIEQALAAEGR